MADGRNAGHTEDPGIARRRALLARMERFTEIPLLLLAFLMVPLLVGPLIWEVDDEQQAMLVTLGSVAWAAFAADFIAKLIVAPRRFQYLNEHRLEAVVLLAPVFRPLLLARLFTRGGRAISRARRLVRADFLLVYAFGLVLLGATLITSVEQRVDGAIRNFGDGLWWAMATVTTVGYGDTVPETTAGRVIGVFMMITGIGLFSGFAANFAAFMMRRDRGGGQNGEMSRLLDEINNLRAEVAALRQERSA